MCWKVQLCIVISFVLLLPGLSIKTTQIFFLFLTFFLRWGWCLNFVRIYWRRWCIKDVLSYHRSQGCHLKCRKSHLARDGGVYVASSIDSSRGESWGSPLPVGADVTKGEFKKIIIRIPNLQCQWISVNSYSHNNLKVFVFQISYKLYLYVPSLAGYWETSGAYLSNWHFKKYIETEII